MLNDLVNNTGSISSCCYEPLYEKQCMEEIYCCINDIQKQANQNTKDIKDIKDTKDISVKSVTSTSVTATSITTSGIKADEVETGCINVTGGATVGSLTSGDIKAQDIESNSIHTQNIDGLNSLTVDGYVWADKANLDNLDVVGCIKADRLDTDRVCTEVIESDINQTHVLEADCAYVGCFITPEANIDSACIGNLQTSNLSSDSIDVARITSTSLSVPKVETSGGITGKGTIDTTSAVWKEIKLPLFTGTVQFYTDEWKVTVIGGRQFIWEDPSLEHLKFLSCDGQVVTVAVDWDGQVFYTYNVAKEEPTITLEDNVGHTENNDHTFIMQDSGISRGTVFIYEDREFTDQGITILGKIKASNLEVTCGESIECVSISNLCVGNAIISDNPIAVDICARHFCVTSPESYINGSLYTEGLYTKDLCYDTIYVEKGTKSPKNTVTYSDGILCSSHCVCVDDDTVYAKKSCAEDFYGTFHGKATDTTCFDGRTFEKACDEILSGKAKTAGLADYAKQVCIGKHTSTSAFIPFSDKGCVFVNDDNPKVVYDKEAVKCIDINGNVCVKDTVTTPKLEVNDVDAVGICATKVCSDILEVETCAQFKGPVYFYDNIYQCGETWCTHAQNIYTCSDTITLREGAISAGNAQIVALKYDGENNGVIFLGTDGTLRVGDENNCQPVLTRSEESNLTDGHVLVWDSTNRCAKDSGSAIVTCAYVNCVGKACKGAACDYATSFASLCDTCNKAWTCNLACDVCTKSYNHADCVGTLCYQKACSCSINMDTLCLACSKAYTDTQVGIEAACRKADDKACLACSYACTKTAVDLETACRKAADTLCTSCAYKCASTVGGNACAYAVSCSHSIGTSCKTSACTSAINMDKVCLACSYSCGNSVCTNAITRDTLCLSCAYNCVNTVCCSAINMDALCLACSCAYSDTKALCSCAFAVTCGHAIGKACNAAVCCNTITRDTLCLSCAYACARTKGENACTYASGIGTACKGASITCAHSIGTACKNAAMNTKANCYGNCYSCVQCSHIARNADLACYITVAQRYVYIGNPNDTVHNVGCNPNFWFCPTCNVLTMGDANGSAICLIGTGSCCMNGVCSRRNPSIVFTSTDNQCGCLQYNQYDAVHLGAGLCWGTNTPQAWFDTDCIFANKFINRNGCQIGGYCATLTQPGGQTNYALLDFGNTEGVAYFSVHDNEGTIVKALSTEPYGKVYAQNTYGITGFYSLGTEKSQSSCIWLRYNGWRFVYLWSKYPIKVVSNTTTNPGCTWQAPVIKPTCDYVNTVGGQCKNASCTYANTVAGQCKGVACTYAYCAINACKGTGVMGVARSTDGQCWTKAGYWAYMTSLDGPNCSWNHVIKMDWSANVDPWATGISIPSYTAPKAGIHYKAGCCGGHSGWTLVPNISCVQTVSCGCASSIGTACKNAACAFAAACAQAVVPETSTFAKCYGNSTNCVACADKVRISSYYGGGEYRIPFAKVSDMEPNTSFASSSFLRYNPTTDTLCASKLAATNTLSVSNKLGCFMLGNYCIYIE